jgi:hypothetical protein
VLLGEETRAGEFPECGIVGSRAVSGIIHWGPTGVLIHPRLVLTAKHMLAVNPNVFAYKTCSVRPGAPPENGVLAKLVGVKLVSSASDILLLVLEDDAIGVEFAKLPPQDSVLEKGLDLRVVGFGYNNPQQTEGFGTQRKAIVTIREVNAGEFVARGQDGADTCVGDSGGPAYREGTRQVIGVTSRSVQTGDCGAGGIYTAVSPHGSAIRSAMDNFRNLNR